MSENKFTESLWDFSFVIMMIITLTGSGNSLIRMGLQVLFIGITMLNFKISDKSLGTIIAARALFVVWCAFSSMWALYADVVVGYIITLLQSTLLSLCVLAYVSSGSHKRVNCAYITIILASLLAMASVLRTYSITALLSGSLEIEGRISVNGLNGNLFGVCAGYSCILLLGYWDRAKKIILIPLMGILGLFALLTGSRKAVLTILIGIALFGILNAKNAGQMVINIIVVAVIIAACIYLMMNVDFLYDIVGHRVESLWGFVQGGQQDKSTESRMVMLQEARELFHQHPILGIGLHNYKQIGYYQRVSHNNYYELLACVGSVGCFLYYVPQVAVLCSSVIRMIKGQRKYLVVFLGLVCFMINDYGMVSYSHEMLQIVLMTFLGTYVYYRREEKECTIME